MRSSITYHFKIKNASSALKNRNLTVSWLKEVSGFGDVEVCTKFIRRRKTLLRSPFHYKTSKATLLDSSVLLSVKLYVNDVSLRVTKSPTIGLAAPTYLYLYKTEYSTQTVVNV